MNFARDATFKTWNFFLPWWSVLLKKPVMQIKWKFQFNLSKIYQRISFSWLFTVPHILQRHTHSTSWHKSGIMSPYHIFIEGKKKPPLQLMWHRSRLSFSGECDRTGRWKWKRPLSPKRLLKTVEWLVWFFFSLSFFFKVSVARSGMHPATWLFCVFYRWHSVIAPALKPSITIILVSSQLALLRGTVTAKAGWSLVKDIKRAPPGTKHQQREGSQQRRRRAELNREWRLQSLNQMQ